MNEPRKPVLPTNPIHAKSRRDGAPLVTLYVALDRATNSEQPPEGFLLELPVEG